MKQQRVSRFYNNKTFLKNSYTENFIQEKSFNFWVGDIESYLDADNQWVLKLIIICNGTDFFIFNNLIECFEFLRAKKTKIRLFFHNLDFDLLFFLRDEYITEFIQGEPLITSGNMILSLKIDNVEFVNSLSLFPMSLKNIVKKFLNVKDERWENNKQDVLSLDNKTLETYCKKDVLYLFISIYKYQSFFLKNFKTDMRLTTPALAYKIFKDNFMSNNLLVMYKRKHKFFKKGYYFGGHTEKFVNKQKVFRNRYYYDVRSLYPFIMRDLIIIDDKKSFVKPSMNKLKKLIKNNKLFYAELTINIDSEFLRFFPVLDKEKKINKYPLGKHRIKCSEVAVKFILKYGDWSNILKVHTILKSVKDKTARPFFKYVSFFYSLRKSSDEWTVLAKLFLTSLYGKFGENEERRAKYINEFIESPLYEMETENLLNIKKISDTCFISTRLEELSDYNLDRNRLDIAGKITEKARLYMGVLINEIRMQGYKVDYTDTDSIITSCNMEDNEKLKKYVHAELGGLEREIKNKDNVIILGSKMYHFYKSGKKATKGVKNMSLKDFREVIRGRIDFHNKRFTKIGALVNKGFFGIQKTPYTINNIQERLD